MEEALSFFGLGKGFSENELKKKYRLLAKKYHPDRGEYTSDVLFLELIRYKNILDLYLQEEESENQPEEPLAEKKKPESDFSLYREAKRIENDAIYRYFKKRDGEPVNLEKEKNPHLRELQKELTPAVELYKRLFKEFPSSIWCQDARDSLEKIAIWLR
ncbi:MAG: DnaJ domain-containing protein [Leptospiraceae bacterium]|nr:DnaJ domain-containing protein [Leptospiraceae bacterium]MCP5499836.1 DnaJ domain-containing protein [Leptospiraceae bacterium]